MSDELSQVAVESGVETDVDVEQSIQVDDAEIQSEYEADIPADPEIAYSWEASEYVHHHKSKLWYGMLAMIVAVLAGIAIWLRSWLEIGVLIGAGGALAVYGHKPPRVMKYELSVEGVHIDGKLYPFSEFRSFGVIPDEEWHSIDLEPAKRLNIRRVILFDTESFDEIVGHLELHLPREDRPLDVIERITRYVRF